MSDFIKHFPKLIIVLVLSLTACSEYINKCDKECEKCLNNCSNYCNAGFESCMRAASPTNNATLNNCAYYAQQCITECPNKCFTQDTKKDDK